MKEITKHTNELTKYLYKKELIQQRNT